MEIRTRTILLLAVVLMAASPCLADDGGAALPEAAPGAAEKAAEKTEKEGFTSFQIAVRIAAEMVSFLVLVYILQRLLYTPLVTMMRERQERIAKQKGDAESAEKEAERLRGEYERKVAAAEGERDKLLAEGREKAEEEKREVITAARAESDKIREAGRRKLELERKQASESLRKELVEQVVGKVAERVATAPLGWKVQEQAVEEVVRLLEGLDEKARKDAAAALAEGESVRIRSAGPLEEAQRQQIAAAVSKTLEVDTPSVEAAEDPSLVAGVEVRIKGLVLKANWRDQLDRAASAES